MAAQGLPNERLPELVTTTISSPEPELQRGRKRRRSPEPFMQMTSAQLPSGESATFRGRSRNRSMSRRDASRRTSRLRAGSLSPSRRKLLRVVHLNRHRSQSPSRSRSPNAQEQSKRRRQRTRSRSREHDGQPKPTEHLSFLRHEIVVRGDTVSVLDKHDDSYGGKENVW